MSNPKKDYYNILEIARDASPSTIKKAYHSLAQKWHPDKNPPEKKEECKVKFQNITEAYGILSDPEKKEKYDRFGICDGEEHEMPQDFSNLSEIFEGMGFGGMGRNRNEQLRQNVVVELTLKEIYSGTKKNISVPINLKCQSCDGTGSKSKVRNVCQTCKGNGIRTLLRQMGPGMVAQQQVTCNICNGSGVTGNDTDKCETCNGKCHNKSVFEREIVVDPNFDHMTVMNFGASGNFDPKSQLSATIDVHFKINDLDKYNMQIANQYDLHMEYNINIRDALSGCSIYWKDHPNGKKYHFKVDSVIRDGETKCARGLGLPHNGKLYIVFKYIYPDTILSEDYQNFVMDRKKYDKHENYHQYTRTKLININEDEENDRQTRGEMHGEIPCRQS